jgi:putative tryptophan/tyrosine transport system substrate-binding protein
MLKFRGVHPEVAVRLATIIVALVLFLTPLDSDAQQAAAVPRVGVLLHHGTPPGFLEAFRTGLQDLGYLEGKNIALELRNAEGKNDQLAALADELVRLRVHLILALNTPAAIAAKKATATIPIVIARVTDPVRSGLVSSLARPGGNVTGLSFNNSELAVKGLELLREALPRIARVGVLSNAGNSAHAPQVAALESAGDRIALKLHSVPLRSPTDLPAAFQAVARVRADALFVLDDTALTRQRGEILKLATAHSLPVVARYKDFADAGALIAYGPNLPAVYRRAAYYVDRLLRGAHSNDLPLEEPSVFDLVVNLKTAKTLSLTISQSVLVRADHVIQ